MTELSPPPQKGAFWLRRFLLVGTVAIIVYGIYSLSADQLFTRDLKLMRFFERTVDPIPELVQKAKLNACDLGKMLVNTGESSIRQHVGWRVSGSITEGYLRPAYSQTWRFSCRDVEWSISYAVFPDKEMACSSIRWRVAEGPHYFPMTMSGGSGIIYGDCWPGAWSGSRIGDVCYRYEGRLTPSMDYFTAPNSVPIGTQRSMSLGFSKGSFAFIVGGEFPWGKQEALEIVARMMEIKLEFFSNLGKIEGLVKCLNFPKESKAKWATFLSQFSDEDLCLHTNEWSELREEVINQSPNDRELVALLGFQNQIIQELAFLRKLFVFRIQ